MSKEFTIKAVRDRFIVTAIVEPYEIVYDDEQVLSYQPIYLFKTLDESLDFIRNNINLTK